MLWDNIYNNVFDFIATGCLNWLCKLICNEKKLEIIYNRLVLAVNWQYDSCSHNIL